MFNGLFISVCADEGKPLTWPLGGISFATLSSIVPMSSCTRETLINV